MTISFVNKGAWGAGTTSFAPGIPASMQDGDLMIMDCHTANHAVTTPSGWTPLGSPVSTGTEGAAGDTRLTQYYRWWQSGDAAPTVSVSGGTVSNGIITGYRGVDSTTPFDGVTPTTNTMATATTTLTFPSITTATWGAWVHLASARDQNANSTANVASYTNANLSGLTEIHDQTVNTAVGGGVTNAYGTKGSVGSTGTTTATQTSSIAVAKTVALRPLAITSGATESGGATAAATCAGPVAASVGEGTGIGESTPVPLDTDANYPKTTILMDFEGTNGSTVFNDWFGPVWSVGGGNSKLTTSSPIRGSSSLLLDGTGDWITGIVPGAIGTGDFTIECEIVVNSLTNDGEIFAISDSAANINNFNIVFEVKTTGALRGSIQTGSGGSVNVDITTATGQIATSTRYHVAFVADGSTARLYIEGVQKQSGSITGTRYNQQTYCRVGHLASSPARDFNGRIDMLRVRKGECLYPSGTTFTPPTSFTTWNRLSLLSNLTTTGTNDAQGVASDGTHVWYSSSSALYKYTEAGSLVTSRSVTGDNPTSKSQINGIKIHDGYLYVCAAENSDPRKSWVCKYDKDALTYISHVQITGDWFIEGIDYHDGYWWVVFHANKVVAQLDSSFAVVATHDMSFSITGSSGGYGAGTGYDGIAWYGDHVFCNIHNIYNEDFCDVYGWTGTDFVEVARLRWPTSKAHQGLALDPVESNILWFAERAPTGTDGFCKVQIIGSGEWAPVAADAAAVTAASVASKNEAASASEVPAVTASFVAADTEPGGAVDSPSVQFSQAVAKAESATGDTVQAAQAAFVGDQYEAVSATSEQSGSRFSIYAVDLSETLSPAASGQSVLAVVVATAYEAGAAADTAEASAIFTVTGDTIAFANDVADYKLTTSAWISELCAAIETAAGVALGKMHLRVLHLFVLGEVQRTFVATKQGAIEVTTTDKKHDSATTNRQHDTGTSTTKNRSR